MFPQSISRRLALSIAASAVLASPLAAQTKWNLPGAYAATNYHSETLVWFAEEVKKASGGKLEITVHPGASLFKAPEIKRAVATGQAQMGEVLISIHENEDPVFGIDSIPFLTAGIGESRKLWDASKGHIAKKLDSQGIRLLYASPWPNQGLYAKKDIATVADLKGLKMRTYNVGTSKIAELAGAQAVTVQAADLAQALATGTVNAFMTSGATGFDIKTWESMSHFYDLQAWQPLNVVFVNKAAFAGLAADQQEAITKSAAAAEDRAWTIAAEKTAWYLEQLKSRGMKVLPPSAELKAGFTKFGEQIIADWRKKAGADGEAVLAAFKK